MEIPTKSPTEIGIWILFYLLYITGLVLTIFALI